MLRGRDVSYARVAENLIEAPVGRRASGCRFLAQGLLRLRHGLALCVWYALAALGFSCIAQSLPVSARPPVRHGSGYVIIKFKDGERARASARAGADELTHLLLGLDLPPGAALEETIFGQWQRRQASVLDGADRHLLLRLPSGLSETGCVARLRGHPLVDFVEPDAVGTSALTIPTDPFFQNQWHHRNTSFTNSSGRADIRTPEAWDITQGSSNVTVGILDTGLNAGLAEFNGRVVPGYDFVDNDSDPGDGGLFGFKHGTIITGLLGASANNGTGVAGVDWNCKLMPIRVVRTDDTFVASALVDAIDWAVTHGCKVINMSLASTEASEIATRAITNAIGLGVIVVGITDNVNGPISFPGNLTNLITVGTTDIQDNRWSSSGFGPQIDLVAPGVNVVSIDGNGNSFTGTGTSASAPLVSGAAALLCSVRPQLDCATARTLLCAGADDQVGNPAQDTPGFDVYHGWGRLNVYNSLLLALTKIQSAQVTNGNQMLLAWRCPPNANSKRPYRVEWAPALTGSWTTLNSSAAIAYRGTNATWLDDGSETGAGAGKFYRLRVVAE